MKMKSLVQFAVAFIVWVLRREKLNILLMVVVYLYLAKVSSTQHPEGEA
jgi:hypothetical protein